MQKAITTVEARPAIKIAGGIIQWIGILCIIAGIVNLFIGFMPKWVIIPGIVLYFLGMILGTKVTLK